MHHADDRARRRRRVPTDTPTTGNPCTKFAVPSSGSTNQPTSARVAAGLLAEERELGSGVVQRRSRTARSLAVSASLTQSPGPFSRTLRAAPNASSTIAAPAAAARRAATSSASRSRSTLTGASLRAARRAAPACPRPTSCRRASASATDEVAPVGVDDERAGFLADEQRRRGSPTARAGRGARRGSRRGGRRRRRTARARPSRGRGTAATRAAPAASPTSAITARSIAVGRRRERSRRRACAPSPRTAV